jgi:hypothetical protein
MQKKKKTQKTMNLFCLIGEERRRLLSARCPPGKDARLQVNERNLNATSKLVVGPGRQYCT